MTTDKYKGTYRIPSARWRDWDYGSNASYFVTVCTAHRVRYFGDIADGEMTMSAIGQRAYDCWLQIPAHFPFVLLGAFVVMPNHVHGIIVIDKHGDVETQNFASPPQQCQQRRNENMMNAPVETQNFASLQQQQCHSENTVNVSATVPSKWQQNKFGPQSQNLGSIIRGFKIGVTQHANQNAIPFAWQTRFHDRVIRNYDELTRTEQYIDTNISNWYDDEFYTA